MLLLIEPKKIISDNYMKEEKIAEKVPAIQWSVSMLFTSSYKRFQIIICVFRVIKRQAAGKTFFENTAVEYVNINYNLIRSN